jgi:hypothetical protein
MTWPGKTFFQSLTWGLAATIDGTQGSGGSFPNFLAIFAP